MNISLFNILIAWFRRKIMEKRDSLHLKKSKFETDITLPKLLNETKNQ